MTIKQTDEFRVEVEIRVVNNKTGEPVDYRGHEDMRGHVKSATDFSPMKAVLPVRTNNDIGTAIVDLNKLFTVVKAISELP